MLLPHQEMHFKGLAISGGVVMARVCLFNDHRHNPMPRYRVAPHLLYRERQRLEESLELAVKRLSELVEQATSRLGPSLAGIFISQKLMLQDPELKSRMLDYIDGENINAEAAVIQSLERYEEALAAVDNAYLRERVSDVAEVKRRLLAELVNVQSSLVCHAEGGSCVHGHGRVVCAEELTPALTMELDAQSVMAFVTEHGGAGSHAAILARALGIPAVSGLPGIHEMLSCGTPVLVDGEGGEVVAWPSPATLAGYPAVRVTVARVEEVVEPVPALRVYANVGGPDELESAIVAKAEGIGLYRTEMAFLAADHLLTEAEQFELYAHAVTRMDGKPLTFRLLDLGGDKAPGYLDLPKEENPFLGLRGGRLLLARPELLQAQARALAKVSKLGPINILYPMIVDLEQFLALRELFLRMTHDIPTGIVRHGVMFETPSACLDAREILSIADFASIGTNDLTQYLFAVDRNNEWVAGDYNPDRPAFWKLLGIILAGAHERKRPVSVCGEVAGEGRLLKKLMELGISTVSVNPRRIHQVRRLVQGMAVGADLLVEGQGGMDYHGATQRANAE